MFFFPKYTNPIQNVTLIYENNFFLVRNYTEFFKPILSEFTRCTQESKR